MEDQSKVRHVFSGDSYKIPYEKNRCTSKNLPTPPPPPPVRMNNLPDDNKECNVRMNKLPDDKKGM